MVVPKRVELITTGEELLLGLTVNRHLTSIGELLGRRGLVLQRNVVVSDDADAIVAQFRESWERADLVITTGGLGPTNDDRTRDVIAASLNQKLIHDPALEAAIRERFARLGREMTPNNLKQARRPEHSEPLPNPNGTAPGIWVEQDGRILVMLPGPPNELIPMFEEQVLPRLAARGWIGHEEGFIQIRTAGVGESALETLLAPVFETHPGLNVAFCAHQYQVDVRLSSPDGRYSRAQLQIVANHCREKLGSDFVCFGHDTIVKVVADLLRLQDQDLAVAESCTGGMLANAFSDVCGAAKMFAGGIVCYNNDSKVQLLDIPECLLKQHGAVSAEAAVAMAAGVAEKLEALWGIAITGCEGSCAANNGHPVGTVYIGLHSPRGTWARRMNYPGQRQAAKQRAVTFALDWLRRELIRAQAGGTHPHIKPVEAEEPEDPARAEARKLLGWRRR
jgi:nicotinamide-nucleotide amidase